ncbi:MAG: lysophospholipid acyltransferase family protein [Bacteroidota bacterium]
MQNTIEFFFFRILLLLIRSFSFNSVQKLGDAFGIFIYSVIGLRKGLVLSNLRHAFPEKTEEEIRSIAKGSYRNLFTAYFEILYLDRLSADDLKRMISFPDIRKISDALKKNKGLILLSGHYGNWELLALSVPVLSGNYYTMVVQKQRNPHIDRYMTAMRTRLGNQVVVMERAFRELLRTLSNNGTVALLADQSGPESGIYTEFFGRMTSTHQGPAVLQVRTGAPMIIGLLVREGPGKFRVELEEIDTTGLTGTNEEKMQQISQRHVSVLEKHIRRHPEHWLWMHKRWKHTESYMKKQAAAAAKDIDQ